jgi:hypothetical protein
MLQPNPISLPNSSSLETSDEEALCRSIVLLLAF